MTAGCKINNPPTSAKPFNLTKLLTRLAICSTILTLFASVVMTIFEGAEPDIVTEITWFSIPTLMLSAYLLFFHPKQRGHAFIPALFGVFLLKPFADCFMYMIVTGNRFSDYFAETVAFIKPMGERGYTEFFITLAVYALAIISFLIGFKENILPLVAVILTGFPSFFILIFVGPICIDTILSFYGVDSVLWNLAFICVPLGQAMFYLTLFIFLLKNKIPSPLKRKKK